MAMVQEKNGMTCHRPRWSRVSGLTRMAHPIRTLLTVPLHTRGEKGTKCGLRSNASAVPATVSGMFPALPDMCAGPLETAVFREGCAGDDAASQETCRHDGCDRDLSGGVS